MLFKYLQNFIDVKMPSLEFWRKKLQQLGSSSVLLKASMGDITQYSGDAIVNAANTELMAGGGVCGAIFRASDFDKMEEACANIGYCPTGEARVTQSFGMAAPWVVHAVGPVWRGGGYNEAALLESAYISALTEAYKVGARSIAFPAISTGIYGYPLEEATKVAVQAVQEYTSKNPSHFERVDFLCFDALTLDTYNKMLEQKPLVDISNSCYISNYHMM